MKKTTLTNKSIRSHTLIYFLVMALAMITLLWAVQEWFFSTQYSRFKQREITRVLDDAIKDFSWPPTHDYLDSVRDLAVENNMVIYFFCFRPANNDLTEPVDYNGEQLQKLNGALSNEFVLSAVNVTEQLDKGNGDDLGWTPAQQDRFVRILNLNGGKEFAQERGVWLNEEKMRLHYASCAAVETSQGQTRYFYFYAEAAVSNKDVAIDIIRFEFVLLTVMCVILALIFSILLSSMLSRPITKISRNAEKLASGDYTTDFSGSGIKEINNLADTLNFAASEFNKTEQMRRDFIANISHDLRTPLTMVKAYAEMIRDISGASPEKRRQHAEVIIEEAGRLSSLVEDIQKLSKIQSGTDAITPAPFNLDELCRTVVRQFSLLHERLGHKLNYTRTKNNGWGDHPDTPAFLSGKQGDNPLLDQEADETNPKENADQFDSNRSQLNQTEPNRTESNSKINPQTKRDAKSSNQTKDNTIINGISGDREQTENRDCSKYIIKDSNGISGDREQTENRDCSKYIIKDSNGVGGDREQAENRDCSKYIIKDSNGVGGDREQAENRDSSSYIIKDTGDVGGDNGFKGLVESELTDDSALTVNADRDKISQVLYNLIGNAINYAKDGDKRITVRAITRGRKAIVEVEDNGKGIAEDDLDAVWDRYYRANQVKRTVVGSGLGLSIVKNILTAHKAEYGVKSELGQGTIFWFALPLGKKKK